ncbi:MAG: hypothetical protein WC584_02345 [Candidatus Pacearchaeota archaeon]
MNKRGVNVLFVVLISIFLVFIIAMISLVVFFGDDGGKLDIAVESFPVEVEIDPLSVMLLNSDYGNTNISLKIKRNSGEGNITALKFIIYDGTYTHEEIINTTLKELTERIYIVPIGFLNPNSLQTITVIPILLGKEGEKKLARFGEELNFTTNRTRTVTPGGGGGRRGGGGSSSGGGTSTCTPTKTCTDYIGQCGTQLSDGCSNVLNCANNCDVNYFYCYKGQGDITNVCVNNSATCSPQGNSCVNSTALAQFYCYYNGTSFKFRNITSTCVNGCQGNECLGPCDLTSASWNVTTAVEGEMVELNVQGNNCNGKNLNYTIYKDILLWFDTKIMTTSSQGSTTWLAGLKSDGTYSLGNYYFKVFVVGDENENILSNNSLEVSEAAVMVCATGDTRCSGNNLQTCNVQGTAWTNQDCSTTSYCDSVTKTCLACSAENLNCDGEVANGCEINKNNDINNCGFCGNVCGDGRYCNQGICSDNVCTPSTKQCLGTLWQTCNAQGTVWQTTIDCNLTNKNCDAVLGCVLKTCTDGTNYGICSTTKPLFCDAVLETLINKCSSCGCPNGQACQSDGSCKAIVCTNNEKRCNINLHQQCSADGTVWNTLDTCSANENCVAGTGCVLKTCGEQSGDICNAEELCPGTQLTSSDSDKCCSSTCNLPTWNLCSQCGTGLFNLCDKTECHLISENCYYTDGIARTCTACAGITCDKYINSADCNADRCLKNCAWDVVNNLCKNVVQSVCGNGISEGSETCDDGNTENSDGCSSSCAVESRWTCTGQPSVCTLPCTATSCSDYRNQVDCNADRCSLKSCLWDTTINSCRQKFYQMNAAVVKEKNSDVIHLFYDDKERVRTAVSGWLQRITIFHEKSSDKGLNWNLQESSGVNYPTGSWGARYDEAATVLSNGNIVLTYAMASCDKTSDAVKDVSFVSTDNGVTWSAPSDIFVFEGTGGCGGNFVARVVPDDQIIGALNDGSILVLAAYRLNLDYPNSPSDSLSHTARAKGIVSAKSYDGGGTWNDKITYDASYFSKLVYQTWSDGKVRTPWPSRIVQDPVTNYVYLSASASLKNSPYSSVNSVVFISQDNGRTWNFNNPESIGAFRSEADIPRLFFYQNKLYAIVESNRGSNGQDLDLYTRDGANSWRFIQKIVSGIDYCGIFPYVSTTTETCVGIAAFPIVFNDEIVKVFYGEWNQNQEFKYASKDITYLLKDGFVSDFSKVSHDFKGIGWNVNARNFNDWSDTRIKELLDSSHMQFARVLGWDAGIYAPTETQKDYESSNMQGLYKFLEYAKKNKITIQLANWNSGGKFLSDSLTGTNYWTCQNTAAWPVTNCWPDQYFWLSAISHNNPTNSQNKFCHKIYSGNPGLCSSEDKKNRNGVQGVESDHPYSDSVFVNTLFDSLNYIVNVKGYDIDFVSLWNEPNGDWAYHPRDSTKEYPESFRNLYSLMKSKLLSNPSLSNIKLIGFDGKFDQAEFSNIKNNIDVVGIHDYLTGTQQVISAKASTTKQIIIGEAGDNSATGCGDPSWNSLSDSAKKQKVLETSIFVSNSIFNDINEGAYAAARWWYNGDAGCYVATNGGGTGFTDISKYNYNSGKILSESIPQTDYDFRIIKTSKSGNNNLNVVAIDFSRVGESPKLAIWVVNPTIESQQLKYTGKGFSDTRNLRKSLFDNFGEITYFPSYVQLFPNQQLTDTIPAKSIVVYTEYDSLNYLKNYDFSQGSTFWSLSNTGNLISIADSDFAGSTGKSLHIRGYGFALQELPILQNAGGKSFDISFWAKQDAGAHGVVYIQDQVTWKAKKAFYLDSTEWKKYSFNFNVDNNWATPENKHMVVLATTKTDLGKSTNVWFDDVRLVQVGGFVQLSPDNSVQSETPLLSPQNQEDVSQISGTDKFSEGQMLPRDESGKEMFNKNINSSDKFFIFIISVFSAVAIVYILSIVKIFRFKRKIISAEGKTHKDLTQLRFRR